MSRPPPRPAIRTPIQRAMSSTIPPVIVNVQPTQIPSPIAVTTPADGIQLRPRGSSVISICAWSTAAWLGVVRDAARRLRRRGRWRGMSAPPPREVAGRGSARCASRTRSIGLRRFLRRGWLKIRRLDFSQLLCQTVATRELQSHYFIVEPDIAAVRSSRSRRQTQMEILAAAVAIRAGLRSGRLAAD